MPNRVPWEPGFSAGHEVMDRQHQGLLAQCSRLADLCPVDSSAETDREFDAAFEQLKALARAHFEAESSLLAQAGDAELEDHRVECEEFEFLVGEVGTTENFDRLELQRFIALWFAGHIAGSAQRLRERLAGRDAPG
jgi:hemerythrin-like metal-binding protein